MIILQPVRFILISRWQPGKVLLTITYSKYFNGSHHFQTGKHITNQELGKKKVSYTYSRTKKIVYVRQVNIQQIILLADR
jgi:hypothetical protein